MAWVFLVDGVSFEISCKGSDHNPWELRKLFENDAEFRSIKASVGKDLALKITPNEDEAKVTLFIGAELHEDRHISQFETVTCVPASDADRQKAVAVADQLVEVVSRIAPGLSVTRRSGIILSQFD